jgi:zinc/manganese transport system substrate-binding protein
MSCRFSRFIAISSLLATLSAVSALPASAGASNTSPAINVVAAENEYGNVASQIGGRFVRVTSVENNPNTDPHSYEVSPAVAQEVSAAQVVIQNGIGYDAFMNKIEAASPSSRRIVIDVQSLLNLSDNTPNPHLWYKPSTMPKVAYMLAADFIKVQPAHAAYFGSRLASFLKALQPWFAAIQQFKRKFPDTTVATTEPVADYMLAAAGTHNLTPFSLQADIMNGVDPAPQDVTLQDSLFTRHKVKAFIYNVQVTDALTQSFITEAKKAHVPVVGVYETMPVPGFDYQTWMLAEVHALEEALAHHTSTTKL